MNATPTGYRHLQTASMYRPFYEPLFSGQQPTQVARPVRVMVWTDEAVEVGSRLGFEVFRGDGTTLESIADVAWVEPQPRPSPARFRLGLAVFARTDPGQEALERLLEE